MKKYHFIKHSWSNKNSFQSCHRINNAINIYLIAEIRDPDHVDRSVRVKMIIKFVLLITSLEKIWKTVVMDLGN